MVDSADLDQFGRDNSHGALIGGEGLVVLLGIHDSFPHWLEM